MSLIEEFLIDIDRHWKAANEEHIPLCLIGATALMLQANYERGTKDSDVIETVHLAGAIRESLLAIAGEGSALHARHRLYIDLVPSGLPFLPQAPTWHLVESVNPSLRHFEVSVLDITDVVVSKLKRFSANDVSDIEAMIERDLVVHEHLVARLLSAVDAYSMDARAEDLPRYVQNFNRVERDMLDVDETDVELPGWI